MKNKKHSFSKIWLKVTIPITLVSAIAMALVLGLTLTAMNVINISRIERNIMYVPRMLSPTI